MSDNGSEVSLCGLVCVVCVQPHNANHKGVICQDYLQALVCLDPELNLYHLFVEVEENVNVLIPKLCLA